MKFLYLVVVIFLCGLIGTAVGEILSFFLPASSYFYNLVNNPLFSSFSVKNLNLVVCTISIAVNFKITVFTISGIIIGCIYGLTRV